MTELKKEKSFSTPHFLPLWCLLVAIITVALMSDAPPFTIGLLLMFALQLSIQTLQMYAIFIELLPKNTVDLLMMNRFIMRPIGFKLTLCVVTSDPLNVKLPSVTFYIYQI